MVLPSEEDLQIGLKQWNGKVLLEVLGERLLEGLVVDMAGVAIFNEYPVCRFRGDSFYLPDYFLVSPHYLINVFSDGAELIGNGHVQNGLEKSNPRFQNGPFHEIRAHSELIAFMKYFHDQIEYI